MLIQATAIKALINKTVCRSVGSVVTSQSAYVTMFVVIVDTLKYTKSM